MPHNHIQVQYNNMSNTTEQDIQAMGDSVDVINRLVAVEALSNEERVYLRANADHLSIMLGRDNIQAYTGDKSVYVTAIHAGYAKLGA